jgi:RNA polymerase sigma-70 factor (ECF subfamily)
LLHAIRAGDAVAKAALFHRYLPRVQRVVSRILGRDRELPDVLQDVFVHALSSIHTVHDPQALESWLAGVAKHTSLRFLRERSRRSSVRLFWDDDEQQEIEPLALGYDPATRRALRSVYTALDRMPTQQRRVFALRYIEGVGLCELAASCGVSLATAKRRLRRAEAQFARQARHLPELSAWLKGGSRRRSGAAEPETTRWKHEKVSSALSL